MSKPEVVYRKFAEIPGQHESLLVSSHSQLLDSYCLHLYPGC